MIAKNGGLRNGDEPIFYDKWIEHRIPVNALIDVMIT